MTLRVSTDTSLALALQTMVADLDITPQCILPGAVAVGNQTLIVTSDLLPRLSPGMNWTFYDGKIDIEPAIDSEWDGTNPVVFDWTGIDAPGFRFTHAAGTVGGTNLFIWTPNVIDNMLEGGEAVMWLTVAAERDILVAGHQVEPVFAMHFEYRRMVTQPKGESSGRAALMNTNTWAALQQQRCRDDMTAIADAIRGNPTLTTANGEHATDIGDPLNPNQERFLKSWTKTLVDQDTQHFGAQGDFFVRGFRQVFGIAS